MSITSWLPLTLALSFATPSVAAQPLSAPPVAPAMQDGGGQSEGPAVDPRRDSPQSTMFTFLGAIHRAQETQSFGAWSPVLECIDFSRAEYEPDSRRARAVARDLYLAINKIRVVEEGELPDTAALDPAARRWVYFPRLEEDRELMRRIGVSDATIGFTRSEDGNWRFSPRTVAGASALLAALDPLDSAIEFDASRLLTEPWLQQYVPATLKDSEFLGLEPWQWLGLLVLALAGVFLDQVVRHLVRGAFAVVLRRVQIEPDAVSVRRTVRPIGLLASGLLWLAVIDLLGFPGSAGDVLETAIRVFTILSGTWAGWNLADLVGEVLSAQAAKTSSKLDDIVVPLLRKAVKIFIVSLGLVYAAQTMSINIVPLITGLGIGGLAFAFAAKDTIENLFGSVAVVLDRPFEVGDWVVIGDVEGTVESLGFRSSRVRTFYNSQVTVPNAGLVRATVDNYGRRRYRRWKTNVGVQYDTPPDKLIAFAEGIRELVRTHPYTRKDYFQVWVTAFAASSIDILIYVFHEVPDWSTELRERERLILDIVRLADRLGVSFAFPTQTLHVYNEEHTPHSARHEPPGSMADRRAMIAGIREAQAITASQPWHKERPGAVTYQAGPTHLDDATQFTEDSRSTSSESPGDVGMTEDAASRPRPTGDD